ncbi:MAG: Holliday junction branch migration protein RuvA [Treponema sp.]|jgi:Holliday junction DNA helicase RuvA|nr:Holliday junction branch migration protein RuvA [Treponema sp.]
MFNSIRGTITGKNPDSVFILSGGVEWDIAVPAADIGKLPPLGEEGRLFTWLYHREDQMRLYGFADEKRRSTFLELIKVEGIGPKGGLKILGGIDQEELEEALEAEDLGRLERVPGLGKKTAQKMILALRGKLVKGEDTASPYGDLVEALAGMGYERREAQDALGKAAGELGSGVPGPEREALLIKKAIAYLSGVR